MPTKKGKIKVLFLCTGNSCRSQMAEGWTRELKSEEIEPYSAGIEPSGISSYATEVMAEKGIDISRQKSQHLTEFEDVQFDYVITLCNDAHENCPLFPGKAEILHVGFEDPPVLAADTDGKEEKLKCHRKVRDDIRKFAEGMPENLKGRNKNDHT